MAIQLVRRALWTAYVAVYLTWSRVPWEIDRLFGFWVWGMGVIFLIWPDESIHYGFGFLRDVMAYAPYYCMAAGGVQMIVGIRGYHHMRTYAAWPCAMVFSATMVENASPTGHLAYAIGFIAEMAIITKRYE